MTRPRAPLLALLLLIPGAAADCTQSEPCTLRVNLDGSVWFETPDDREATVRQHHWYVLDVLNQADGNHTLTVAEHTFTAPGYDAGGPRSRHGPVQFAQAGDLTLRDETTGGEATVRVEAAPPPEPEPMPSPTPGDDGQDGQEGQDGEPPERRKDVPAPLLVPLAALALAALARKNRP